MATATRSDELSDFDRAARSGRVLNYLNHDKRIRSWVFTLDHKRVGVMFLASVVASLVLGAAFAVLVRMELMYPGLYFSRELYHRFFTLHGAVMIFLFVIPATPSAIGNFVLPLMLGAKDVAFPRLNLFSYHLYVIAAVFFVITLALGGIDTGWTFYAPYSVQTNTAVATALAGAFLLGFGSIFTGINFIVTTHTLRPKDMTWMKMPLMVWALYATSIIQVLATPVLAITLVLLVAERLLGIGVFDPAKEGDPVLYQHLFWFYSHPAVYIMILPAMGIISEVISVHSRKHIFGYTAIAWSSVAIALLGFLVWGHHMFMSSQSPLVSMIFSALTFSVAIPSAIKVFNWIATLYKGSIHLTTPMCYALIFIFLFGLGGLTGLFLGALATNVQVHDTAFVVAHFHYVMVGGALMAFIAGVHHWWPKITGKMYYEPIGRITALVIFIAFNMTYFPQFIIGAQGMPRRYADFEEQIYRPEGVPYTTVDGAEMIGDGTGIPWIREWQIISSIGGFLFVAGILTVIVYLLYSLFAGKRAPENPWGGATMEWATPSPPPYDNFEEPPTARDPYDFSNLRYDANIGGYVRYEQ